MNNTQELLFQEYERLRENLMSAAARTKQTYSHAIRQETRTNAAGEEFVVDYIELDQFTPEERARFEECVTKENEQRARLNIFENFIKERVPNETLESFQAYIEPTSTYQNTTIPCNDIGIDQDGNFTRYDIRVGNARIESPKEMTFEEYQQLYTSNLEEQLKSTLNTNLSQEEIQQQIQNACTEVYLSSSSKRNIRAQQMDYNLGQRQAELDEMFNSEEQAYTDSVSYTKGQKI